MRAQKPLMYSANSKILLALASPVIPFCQGRSWWGTVTRIINQTAKWKVG
jgi:hypothetical protein